ncbi:ComEA family DNA-binding protein [Neisseria shayeganii]|uniref:Helix-hairpin-helix domain-containing protein n=1 Tax=Neisseria shayeganii TaxID=607712 RepID=A0A7D7NAP3_9NEIS|nr:helix-hairpin-helix domain-containing protein [Neisseria shayeganii]
MKKLLFMLFTLLNVSLLWAQVNINTATAQELQTLNGIGPAKANAIIEYRNANGPFKSVEELKNVRGIGSGVTFQRISEQVTVSGSAAQRPAAQPATRPNNRPAAQQPAAAKPATAKP